MLAPPPKDWIDTPNNNFIYDRFLASKAPLCPSMYAVGARSTYTVKHCLKDALARAAPVVAAINLTSGTMYRHELIPWGRDVAYYHIPCLDPDRSDRDDIPTDDAWHAFFLAVQRHPVGTIVVHCTHGFNRTLYMIARWMHTMEGFSVAAALEHCSIRRPPGIYKAEYVVALHEKHNSPLPKTVPPWPDWRMARASVGGLHSHAVAALKERTPPLPLPLEFAQNAPPDVGSLVRYAIRLGANEATTSPGHTVRKEAQEACGGSNAQVFSGTQPVALAEKHIADVKTGYLVSWKVDGIRVLLVLMPFGTFTMNRRNEVRIT